MANKILRKKKKVEDTKEIWKDDEILNVLLVERTNLQKRSQPHKDLTKKIKRRVNKLRNAKLQQEADEINHFAAKREVEDLFRSFKVDRSTFKSTKRKYRCDQEKLREFFTRHFSLTVDENDEPNELKETPEYGVTTNQYSTSYERWDKIPC